MRLENLGEQPAYANVDGIHDAEDSYEELCVEDRTHRGILIYFFEPELFREYKQSQMRSFNFSSVLPLILVYYIAAATRFSLQSHGGNGPLFLAAFIAYLFAISIFTVLLASHLVCSIQKHNQHCLSYKMCDTIIKKGFGGRIEDIVTITSTLMVGLYLLARVGAGQCAAGTNIWDSQACNPTGSLDSIPNDELVFLYAVPIAAQSVMRGISIGALIVCWALVVFFVAYALMELNGWLEVWSLLYSIIFMNISCEMERFNRVIFIQSKVVARSIDCRNSLGRILKGKYAEDERKMKEQETLQLRSLMGNVAHDMKTPLHSIEADLEALTLFFSKISPCLLQQVVAEFHRKCALDSFDPLSICRTLKSSCKFMGMAINRSQDFMKASNEIPLVPSIETFELKAAIDMSVGCINQLQSAREIIVHRLPRELCSYIISDKHWLSENILCLLSNAMKFSNEGSVDVRIKVLHDNDHPSEIMRVFPEVKTNPRSIERGDSLITVNQVIREDSGQSLLSASEMMILITVEDSGVGITEKARKNLFQPLKQTQRVAGGVGLGLYCLSKRIEALGGAVGVTSRADDTTGSMFWFTFPYRPDDDTARTDCHDDSFANTGSTKLNLQAMRILVVDDSISILKVTSRLLKMNGHTVETASNGSIGLDMLKAGYKDRQFDMVLTDIQMPIMDGNEATELFRKYEDKTEIEDWGNSILRKSRLLIVGMSANTDEQSREGALKSGMDYFIAKPFAYKDLLILLQSIQPDMKSCV